MSVDELRRKYEDAKKLVEFAERLRNDLAIAVAVRTSPYQVGDVVQWERAGQPRFGKVAEIQVPYPETSTSTQWVVQNINSDKTLGAHVTLDRHNGICRAPTDWESIHDRARKTGKNQSASDNV